MIGIYGLDAKKDAGKSITHQNKNQNNYNMKREKMLKCS